MQARLSIRAQACKAQHRGNVLATVSRKEQGVKETVCCLPGCVFRRLLFLKLGIKMRRNFVRWRRGGGGPPCGRNSKGLVLFDAPFSFAGPDRFQSFPCQGLIPTSQVNERSPNFPHLDPQLLAGGRPALPHFHSTSSLRFLLPLSSQQAPSPWGLC